MQKVDYLIVGQGIAGTLLAWFLEKEHQEFLLIDDGHVHAASKIAAGIINPITGRRFVKSWMIETLFPFAKHTYQAIEKQTQLNLWEEVDIIRYFQTTIEANNWLVKTNYEGYGQFLSAETLKEDLTAVVHDTGGYGIVKGAKVAVGELVTFFQQDFEQKGRLIKEVFDYQRLTILENGVQYGQIVAKKVIFCEGYAAHLNPWFSHLPFESAKGEVLLLKIPHLQTQYIIKKNQFLVPLLNDLFWFGANYEWDNLTTNPTKTGKAFLVERLSDILKLDYEIVAHLAGVRPVLKDRRPVLGVHPTFPSIGILNGMGTKGTSIAPYWAYFMAKHLIRGESVPNEVGLTRFFRE